MVGDYAVTLVNLSMGNLAFSIESLVFLQNCWIPEIIVIFGIATSEPAQPQWWWWKQEYKERNWFNKQNKYFECKAHFLYIFLLLLHIINIVKLDRKGIAIVGVVSMIIASSRVGLWFPPKYPCRVSQVLAHLLLLYRLWTPGVYQN